ncbi:glutamate-cysteine ligase family protein [Alloscardovia criceti]|uniref:glutamate-cysteine ligase family protein n=1 Tax=Alloscardovia criceti TaxID=356828 RepID=UPI00037E3DF3|nr:glutamate-cysteine ligase family protein [Alloscardovia criceti]
MYKDFPYFHLDRSVNPKHLQSVVNFYASGCVPCEEYGIGVEIEHLPVRKGSHEAVTYAQEHGIRDILHDLAPLYDASKEYYDGGHLLGLARGKIAISLEPGGQIECSLGVLTSPEELDAVYAQFRADIDPILEKHQVELLNYGYTPVSSARDIHIIPKQRYAAMDKYLGRLSSYGWNMMRASASTQISLDYSSEEDAIAKMRMGVAVGPLLNYFFRNTPFFEGRTNSIPLLRQHMWDGVATGRTGINPGLFDKDYSFEKAAYDVLATPMMVADVTHTPEAQGSEPQVWMASFDNAADVYPDRELNEAEITHIISTHFNDVRLKNFIELRHWDSLPIERARILADIVVNLFTQPAELDRLQGYFEGISVFDINRAKLEIQAQGREAKPYGQSLEFWREFLHAEYTGDDIPGDPHNPDVFQN